MMIKVVWLLAIVPLSAAYGFSLCALLTIAKIEDERMEKREKERNKESEEHGRKA